MTYKTETTVAEAWQRIHANDAPVPVYTRTCSCGGREWVREETKLRAELVEIAQTMESYMVENEDLRRMLNKALHRFSAERNALVEVEQQLVELMAQRAALVEAGTAVVTVMRPLRKYYGWEFGEVLRKLELALREGDDTESPAAQP